MAHVLRNTWIILMDITQLVCDCILNVLDKDYMDWYKQSQFGAILTENVMKMVSLLCLFCISTLFLCKLEKKNRNRRSFGINFWAISCQLWIRRVILGVLCLSHFLKCRWGSSTHKLNNFCTSQISSFPIQHHYGIVLPHNNSIYTVWIYVV